MASLPDLSRQARQGRRLVFCLGANGVKTQTPPGNGRGSFAVKIDWTDYSRVHTDRTNLLLHYFAIPLFAGSFAWSLRSSSR